MPTQLRRVDEGLRGLFGMFTQPTPTERPLKLSEMARLLGVSTAWLRGEAERGALPHVKADRGMLFDRETVERRLSERAKVEGLAAVRSESASATTDARQ